MTTPDFSQAEQHLAAVDPVMARLIAAHGPCRIGHKTRDPFHILCTSIISQQLSTKAADTIQGRVQVLLKANPHLAPEHFKGVRHVRLRGCGLSNAKAKWLRDIAGRVRSGAFSFATLVALDDEAAIAMLDALPGIGRWTAEMYLIFALGRLDIFAMDDIGLRRGVNVLYNKGKKLNDKKTLALTKQWAPYRSVASWYLWRSGEAANPNW